MKSLKAEYHDDGSDFEQIDITQSYLEAFNSVIDDQEILSPNLKEKIYPNGIKKITYSPQTESVYYYETEKINNTTIKNTWEIFEDRGASVESRLIEQLSDVDPIRHDFNLINKEEEEIEDMKNGELVTAIIEHINSNGEKAYRYRIDKGTKEKCMIFRFQRTLMVEEIIVFGSDTHLVLNREEEEEEEEGMVHQRVMKYMNRTVVSWYYEGLLRIKRLEDKQKKYIQLLSK
ncbi:MAG: hypothetical protein ACTSQF_06345 [Candidatus Heimdallarchaeaceae archaeon]